MRAGNSCAATLLLAIATALAAIGTSHAAVDDDLRQCGSIANGAERAVAACTRLLKERLAAADLAKVHYNRGIAWFAGNSYDNAITDFDASINLDPALAAAFRSRGIAWFNKNEFDRAIDDLNEAIRL